MCDRELIMFYEPIILGLILSMNSKKKSIGIESH